MEKVINVVLPLFAMIFCGFFLVKLNVIGKEMVKGLVNTVFWLFLPCFIFVKTISIGDYIIDWNLLNAYYSACLFVFIIAAVGGTLILGGGMRTACLRGLAAISGE